MRGDGQALVETSDQAPGGRVHTELHARQSCGELGPADEALLALLRHLAARSYQFVTPAPTTHRRVLIRRGLAPARTLEDVFGWNLPFRAPDFAPELLEMMRRGGILRGEGNRLKSALRVATVGDLQFLHSGFGRPADCEVFFGPDSYRFVEFLRAELPPLPLGASIVDIGAGA
ncbi:MAG: hypothetical protein ACHP7A_08805, partial [Caulobacterales bacterium]